MKIAILGYGIEGHAVEKYFKEKDEEITVFDNFTPTDIPSFNLEDYDLVFRSPTIPPTAKLLTKNQGENWTSVTKYFFDHCPAKIIGVTGTKGKGTTSSMIATILKASGEKTHLLGNIGVPAISILNQIKPNDVVVYELSSFQLWDLEKSPHIAVVLRIEPDHLDVHSDYSDYLAAKANIAKYQTPEDICIYYQNDKDSLAIASLSPGTKIAYHEQEITLSIPGAHNMENAAAAILAAKSYNPDLSDKTIKSALKSFKGLPHRLEFVRELNGVKYYDDNFSSASPALEVAIKAFEHLPTIVIAGGKDRNLDLTPHKKALFHSPNVKKTILIGETKTALAKNEYPESYEFANTLEEAVEKARIAAEACLNAPEKCIKDDQKPKNAIVLMSPGAASFDMFINFQDRGEKYQKLIKNLK